MFCLCRDLLGVVGIEFLVDVIFSSLKMSFHCLLLFIFSVHKPVFRLTIILWKRIIKCAFFFFFFASDHFL